MIQQNVRDKRKKGEASGARLVTVDLIEAFDLPPMDDNGTAAALDPMAMPCGSLRGALFRGALLKSMRFSAFGSLVPQAWPTPSSSCAFQT